LENLIDFILRKHLKNKMTAFQMIKNPRSGHYEDEQVEEMEPLRIVESKSAHLKYVPKTTRRTRNLTGVNTSIEDSDGSYIYSPNVHKSFHRNKTENRHINISENE
jgi:hypothetical protein